MDAPTDWSTIPEAVTEDQPRYANDNKLHVQFYTRPMMRLRETELQGRPIYADVEHVRILVPGDKLSMVDRVASQDDKSRFADHYAKYQAGKGDEVIGTRLEAVPFMTRSKVEEYKFFGIHTVEQLANASDEVGQKFPGFQDDKRKSNKFLESASASVAEARVLELEKMVKKLQAKIEEDDEEEVPDVLAKQVAAPAHKQEAKMSKTP